MTKAYVKDADGSLYLVTNAVRSGGSTYDVSNFVAGADGTPYLIFSDIVIIPYDHEPLQVSGKLVDESITSGKLISEYTITGRIR